MADIKVSIASPIIEDEEINAVIEVMKSGMIAQGPKVIEFEEKFAEYVGAKYGIATNSGTSALHVALLAAGIGEGDEVITTPFTFAATGNSVLYTGAKPVFVDINPETFTIDPTKIEEAITEKTKAIMPVQLYGQSADMDAIMEIAKKHDLIVIEDAAHSFPSPTPLGYGGAIGDAGVFSFYVTKTITTAEGGMVCTRNPELAKRMTTMRMHGMDRTTWDRYTSPRASWEYDIVAPGYKFNLPDVLAALGCCQLDRAQLFYEQRKKVAMKYNEAFSKLDFIQLPPDGQGNSWHLYLMRIIPEKLTISREEFAKKMQAAGLGISVHFIPIFHFTYWKELYPDFTAQNFPNAERQYNQTISIPLYPDMTEEQADYVIKTVIEIGNANKI